MKVDNETVLKVQNVTKIYQDKKSQLVALDNVSFDVKRGHIVAILGHNGAGKSTLVRIITGLSRATFGSVFMDDLDVAKYSTKIKSKIGSVTQDFCLDSFATVDDTLKLQSLYYGKTNNEETIEELLETLDLKEKRNKQNFSLSLGMKRRLMMAKALVHDPQVVILDEPTVGVDFSVRTKILEYIQKLRQNGKTVLLITHHLDEVEKLCNDVVILEHGKVVYNDTKKNLEATSPVAELCIEMSRPITTEEEIMIKTLSRKVEARSNKIFLVNKEKEINQALAFLLQKEIKIVRIAEEKQSLEKTIAAITKPRA